MNDVIYCGRRLRAQAHPLPGGGFAAKIVISPAGPSGGWSHLGVLPDRWASREEAEQRALAVGQRVVDTEIL